MSPAASAALQIEIKKFEFSQLELFQIEFEIKFELLGSIQLDLLQIEIVLNCWVFLQSYFLLSTFQEISWAGHIEVN